MMLSYDPTMLQPMRDELVRLGFAELKTRAEVDTALAASPEPVLLVVNSVCGCAAGSARPGVARALQGALKPARLVTVFAGQDREATAHARSYIKGFAPSSPAMALLKDGAVVFMLERHQIEGRTAEAIGQTLSDAFAKHLSAD